MKNKEIALDGIISKVDVYCVIRAFEIKEPGIQHAIKKLLCAGEREKGSYFQDLQEAIDAITASINYEQQKYEC